MLSSRGAVTLLIDGVVWLDAASIELLAAANRKGTASLLVVGAVNERDLRDGSGKLRPAGAVCESHTTAANVWALRLGRLGREEVTDMTSSIMPGMPDLQELDRALYDSSRGNPLFHEMLLRLAAMHGEVSGSGQSLTVSFPWDAPPRVLDEAIDAVLRRLPTEVAEAAAAVAAAGGPVSVAAIADALGRTAAEAAGLVDSLLELGLLRAGTGSRAGVAPSSARLAERMLTLVQPDFLDAAHTTYADRAARAAEAGLASTAEEAYHRLLASDKTAAARAMRAAGEESLALWQPASGDASEEAATPEPGDETGERRAQRTRGRRSLTSRIARFDKHQGARGDATAEAEASDSARPPAEIGLEAQSSARYMLDTLGPERLLDVPGIPPGSEAIRLGDETAGRRVLVALDRLLDIDERPTAAAVIWRLLAGFEVESPDGRLRLAKFMEDLEPRIWRVRLVEAFKALENTLVGELTRKGAATGPEAEAEAEALGFLAGSAARALREFLRAGQYSRVEKLGRVLARLDTPAAKEALSRLERTDFFDLLVSDLASESAERSNNALAALIPIAGVVEHRLVDFVRTAGDYRLRRLAAEALAGAGAHGGVSAIAQLGPAAPDDEYERIVSVIDGLGLAPEVAEDEIVHAMNHASEGVRRAAISVACRIPSLSPLGILQRGIDEGGPLGARRALQAIGEIRLAEALPIVRKQILDSMDAEVISAGARAVGRMATDPDVPQLAAVKLLGAALDRFGDLPDKDAAENAAVTTLWGLGQYSIPEGRQIVEGAASHPSHKVSTFAAQMLKRTGEGAEQDRQ